MKAWNDRTMAETAENRTPRIGCWNWNRRNFVALSVGTGLTAGFTVAAQPGMAQTTNKRNLPMVYSNKHIATPFGDIAYTEQGKALRPCLCMASSRMPTFGGM